MNAAPHTSLLDRVARAIYEAKIKSCWMKSAWDSRLRAEPWEKPNPASPNQPWHDIAIDQAKAALEACHAEEMQEVIRGFQAMYDFGDDLQDDHPVAAARALIDKLEGR